MLTQREIEILEAYAASGFKTGKTATLVHLSKSSVKYHLSSAMSKLEAPSYPSTYFEAVRKGYASLWPLV